MSSNASRHGGLGRWIVIGVGAFVFAVFAAVLWYAYVEVMGLGAGGPPPLIRAEPGPIKRAPDDPGGMEIPNRDSAAARVFQEQSDGIRRERILPRQDTSLVELEPEPEPPPPAEPPAEPIVEPAPAATTAAVPVERFEAREPSSSQPAIRQPPPAQAGTPPPPPSEAPPPARPRVTVTGQPPAASQPAPTPPPAQAPRPIAPPVASPPTAAPPPSPPPQTAARTAPATVPPARSAPAASPIFRIQLGAFRSDAAANQAWTSLQRRLQAPLGALRPFVLEAQTSAGTFYRLQAGPLPNRDSAVQACAQVKAGGNDCFIVGPVP